jgi:hypothetical protein
MLILRAGVVAFLRHDGDPMTPAGGAQWMKDTIS